MVFIFLFLILGFARSSAYHHTHLIDIYEYLCYGYFGCQCSIIEKSPRQGSKNEWLRIRAVSFVFIHLDLMPNHPFSTLPVAISKQCCIDNQNIHNTNNQMCLSCVRDDTLNLL